MIKTTRRTEEEDVAKDPRTEAPAPPPAAMTPQWASALGNRVVARMAADYAEAAELAEPEDDDAGLLDIVAEALAAVETESDGGEVGESVAMVRRMPLARQPRTKAKPRKIPLNAVDMADLKRVGNRTIKLIPGLVQERVITTEEGEEAIARIEEVMQRAKKGQGDRAVLARNLNKMRSLPERYRKRAAAGRSTKGNKILTDFKVEPPVVKVGQHESARFSFIVKGKPKSISAFILSDPHREGTSYKFFNFDATTGYHQAIWDGTFEGTRNQPPRPGTYRLELSVLGEDGKSESVFEQIRVENPDDETVLPRVGSGLAVSTLTFDGRNLTLTDEGLNTIEVPATSGLKPHNPKNKEKEDYTLPEHQWVAGKGPIPAGNYLLKPSQYQLPNAGAAGTKYPSGGTAAKWGPMRIQILPNKVKNRSEFFLHMDVTNDGTAGCIGIPTGYEGKFNQIMSLIATNKSDVKLNVSY